MTMTAILGRVAPFTGRTLHGADSDAAYCRDRRVAPFTGRTLHGTIDDIALDNYQHVAPFTGRTLHGVEMPTDEKGVIPSHPSRVAPFTGQKEN